MNATPDSPSLLVFLLIGYSLFSGRSEPALRWSGRDEIVLAPPDEPTAVDPPPHGVRAAQGA